MPEGDTVYRAAAALNTALAGRILTRCDIRVPRFATVDLSGSGVDEVTSRGKHLLIRVGAYSIHSHLKMEGTWHVYRSGEVWRRQAFHARIVLATADRIAVGFDLGMLHVVPRDREDEVVGQLGPDLLGADWDAVEAARRLSARLDRPIAKALLDQRNLAGLGNVYVNEVCFLRGILPSRPVGATDIPATVDLAHRLIRANRNRVTRSTTGNLRPGQRSWVYGREREPCRRCGTPILLDRDLNARDSYFCPHCQR